MTAPIVLWIFGITLSSAMMIAAVAFELRLLHFSLSFVIVGFIALAGLRDQRMLQELAAFPSHITSTMVRHMGIIYGWAAVMIALFYMLLLEWTPWFAAFFVMCAGATLCMFMANIIMRDLTEAADDKRMSDVVRSLAKMQFAVCCLCIGGLIALGSVVGQGGDGAWAGINILLATTLGVAGLSAYMIFFPTGFDFGDDIGPKPVKTMPSTGDRRKQSLGAPNGGDRRKPAAARGFGRAKTV